ncbi:tRNA wybutosine-synthesizing protein 3 [Strigomonas culicis]|uniref:tRNA(Phe) 7-[(3-amino-3-carboxypropyl)-4-demethylwyosine(37)-N(4)]-methyltransferase n=1 Tax=Strigomonas culicis TaxID=28005 RepID=S9TZ15_9TRYP|nr:tRNA wybutosine-synthesizing protein 3 [Strigomonas culicis]|eukprot:EPY23772.1 tRNA wybutosine-synthesizing protein 3 [Strigomonas culicis]
MFALTRALARKGVHGGAASEFFVQNRAHIIADLRANTNDKSLAGCVDARIRPLVELINSDALPQYVTSSSCSGRLSLFHRGKCEVGVEAAATHAERKRGSFGRGMLFQSHDPLPDVAAAVQQRLLPALAAHEAWRATLPTTPLLYDTEVVQLKFEPMIVHVLCADVDAASALLQCASEAAQTTSGILSCSRGTAAHRKITCCLTSPVATDVHLFSEGKWMLNSTDFGGAGGTMWSYYLTRAVEHINELFKENERRTERLMREITRRLIEKGRS